MPTSSRMGHWDRRERLRERIGPFTAEALPPSIPVNQVRHAEIPAPRYYHFWEIEDFKKCKFKVYRIYEVFSINKQIKNGWKKPSVPVQITRWYMKVFKLVSNIFVL